MQKKTKGIKEYIFDHILFGAMLGYDWYKVILPLLVPITSFDNSLIRMVICMGSTSLVGIAFSDNTGRTDKGVILDLVFGMGLYTAITLGKYLPEFMKILIGATLIITGIGFALIVCRKINRRSHRKRILKRRFFRSVQMVRRNVGMACGIIMLVLPMALGFGRNEKIAAAYKDRIEAVIYGEYENSSRDTNIRMPKVQEVYGEEYRLSENIDTIKLIRENAVFQTLTYEQKKEVVISVLRCEGRFLGLEEFEIQFADLEEGVLGQFHLKERSITINDKPLKDGSMPGGSADEVLNTCIHECRHYYQYLMVELYMNATPEQRNLYVFTGENVSGWLENILHYHDACGGDMDNYREYLRQPLEADARAYAASEVKEFHKAIDAQLQE